MRQLLLLPALVLLASCQTTTPQEASSRPPLPQAATLKLPALEEGGLTRSLQDSHDALQKDLQEFLNETLRDLQESLARARQSPPSPGPSARGH